ncbi:TetR/AcrR family transcriptional regulator [Antrihabitans cavernicola]|nr:TetR/AcrR family transcriptional regulator [Spelaeibacter cavernicola]
MPKVSAEHRAARRTQIIDAARRRFADNGFHMTSMDDVISESGLSAGALYRYFPSKESLILATIDESLEAVTALGRRVMDESVDASPGQTVVAVLDRVVSSMLLGDVANTRIALYAWTEAQRSPAVREVLIVRYLAIRQGLRSVAVRWLDSRGEPYESDRADAIAKTLLSVLMGFLAQRAILGDVTQYDVGQGLDAIAHR